MGMTREIMNAIEEAEITPFHVLAIQDGSVGSTNHMKLMQSHVMRNSLGCFDPDLVWKMIKAEYEI
jgi:hypothetical protein